MGVIFERLDALLETNDLESFSGLESRSLGWRWGGCLTRRWWLTWGRGVFQLLGNQNEFWVVRKRTGTTHRWAPRALGVRGEIDDLHGAKNFALVEVRMGA